MSHSFQHQEPQPAITPPPADYDTTCKHEKPFSQADLDHAGSLRKMAYRPTSTGQGS